MTSRVLWDSNVAYMPADSHSVLSGSVSVFISYSLALCPFLLICECPSMSLFASTCAYKCFCFICLYLPPHFGILWSVYWTEDLHAVSRWCESWCLGAPTLNSTVPSLYGDIYVNSCTSWADYKALVMSGLISRIMCNVCLWSVSYPGIIIRVVQRGKI